MAGEGNQKHKDATRTNEVMPSTDEKEQLMTVYRIDQNSPMAGLLERRECDLAQRKSSIPKRHVEI